MAKNIEMHPTTGEPIAVNAFGAKGAHYEARYDLLDYPAITVLAEVLGHGAEKYAEQNWRGIPVHTHIDHAIRHLLACLHDMRTGATDLSDEDHLGHAMARVYMALAVREQGGMSQKEMELTIERTT